MKLVQMNWQPSDSQLQQFGMISLFALPGIAWFWGAPQAVLTTLLAVGVVFALTGFVRPGLLKFPFVGLCLVTSPLGLVVSETILMLMYLLIFLPIGAVFALMRRDALALQPQKTTSYWQAKTQPKNVASYYRQW